MNRPKAVPSSQVTFDFGNKAAGVRPSPGSASPTGTCAVTTQARGRAFDDGTKNMPSQWRDAADQLPTNAVVIPLRETSTHIDAMVNQGRRLHLGGCLEQAHAVYRAALASCPTHAIATFNLAVLLEDLGHLQEAIAGYQRTVVLDPSCADAFFNVARLLEKAGQPLAALRALKEYQRLLQSRGSPAPSQPRRR